MIPQLIAHGDYVGRALNLQPEGLDLVKVVVHAARRIRGNPKWVERGTMVFNKVGTSSWRDFVKYVTSYSNFVGPPIRIGPYERPLLSKRRGVVGPLLARAGAALVRMYSFNSVFQF